MRVADGANVMPVNDSEIHFDAVIGSANLTPVTDSAILMPMTDSAILTIVTDSAILMPVTDSAILMLVTDSAILMPVTDSAILMPATDIEINFDACDWQCHFDAGHSVPFWCQWLTVPFWLQIRNKETNQCVDTMGRKSGEKVGLVGCHGQGGNQVCNCALSQIGNPLLGRDVDTALLQFQKCAGVFITHT